MPAKMLPARPAIEFGLNIAERVVYDELARQLPDECTVVYDYAYAAVDGGSFVQGQVDFLVIVPRVGLCFLEVKGTRRFQYKGGRWHRLTATGATVADDPFQQITRNMHSVVKILRRLLPTDGFAAHYGMLVVYPRGVLVGDQMPAAYSRELLVTMNELPRLREIIQETLPRWGTKLKGLEHFDGESLAALVAQLTTGGDLVPVAKEDVADEAARIESLTADQCVALQAMLVHPRVVVSGPAGSGKTLLAISNARRLAANGCRRVYLTCYNTRLADWIRAREDIDTPWEADGLHVYSFHELARKYIFNIGRRFFNVPSTGEELDRFWREVVPVMLDEVAQDIDDRWRADAVVVDEGQDFETSWLVRLQLLLRDPEHGPFSMFKGDSQRLFTEQDQHIQNVDAALRLEHNCRNTVSIGRYANNVGSVHARFLDEAPVGEPPVVLPLLGSSDRAKAAATVVNDWIRGGFELRQIAILSHYGPSHARSTLAEIAAHLDVPTTNVVDQWFANAALWSSTIRAFKGMEADCVVLVDLPHAGTGHFQQDDLYVAVSRGRSRLVLLPEDVRCHADLQHHLGT